MATINAFRGLRPNPAFAHELVLSKPQAESVEIGGCSLKDLLETPARLRPETAAGQAAAYQAIKAALRQLVATGRLVHAERPCIYIYEIEHPGYRQTGVWALTALDDYRNGHIKTHELTLAESSRRLQQYRAATGLEGSPILLAYSRQSAIERIIQQTKQRSQPVTLGNIHGVHRIWEISASDIQQDLIVAFAAVKNVYLADGHHRLESAAATGFGNLSSVYMATDELRITEFDRLVLPEKRWSKAALIRRLAPNFQLTPLKEMEWIRPANPRRLGMLASGRWYRLTARKLGSIGATILQERVLGPVFGIEDPVTDPRLKCIGGAGAKDEIGNFIAEHPNAIAFTLYPLTVEQLIAVADSGGVLPPKSTWIDPKIPYGLILYQHTI